MSTPTLRNMSFIPSTDLLDHDKRRRTARGGAGAYDPRASESSFSVNTEDPAKRCAKASMYYFEEKQVRFSQQPQVVHLNHQICQEELIDLWYTHEDYQTFRQSYVHTTKEIIADEKRRRKSDADDQEELHSLSFIETIERVFAACCDYDSEPTILTELEMIHLCHVMCSPDRLGMERVSSRNIRTDKRMRVGELVDTILEVQRESDNVEEVDYVEEALASLAQEISLPSRLFAMFLAQAVHLSLGMEERQTIQA